MFINMEKKIIFATGNADKMREIRMILADLGMEILSMKEAGVETDIVEDGTTFEENSKIKASAIAEVLKQRGEDAIVLADDSGLEIDYLNKNYKFNFPESDDYETLAGYIIHYHESIPQTGEEIAIGKAPSEK